MNCCNSLELGSFAEFLSAFISLFVFAVGAIISWQIFKKEPTKTYVKERFEKVIYPIYKEIEPHLFKKEITDELRESFEKCQKIIEHNHMISGGKLVFIFSMPLTSENFKTISREIDNEYDRACKQLGIPVRTLLHKYAIYHSRNQKFVWLLFFKYGVLPLLAFGIAVFGIYFLLNFLLHLTT